MGKQQLSLKKKDEKNEVPEPQLGNSGSAENKWERQTQTNGEKLYQMGISLRFLTQNQEKTKQNTVCGFPVLLAPKLEKPK